MACFCDVELESVLRLTLHWGGFFVCVAFLLQSMLDLVRRLADINILPYYVYQCDMVRGCEDFRTPLSTMIKVEQAVRGQITGMCREAVCSSTVSVRAPVYACATQFC